MFGSALRATHWFFSSLFSGGADDTKAEKKRGRSVPGVREVRLSEVLGPRSLVFGDIFKLLPVFLLAQSSITVEQQLCHSSSWLNAPV